MASWGSSVLQSCIVLAGVFTAVLVSLVSSTSLTALPGAIGVEVRGREQEGVDDEDDEDDDANQQGRTVGESAGRKSRGALTTWGIGAGGVGGELGGVAGVGALGGTGGGLRLDVRGGVLGVFHRRRGSFFKTVFIIL